MPRCQNAPPFPALNRIFNPPSLPPSNSYNTLSFNRKNFAASNENQSLNRPTNVNSKNNIDKSKGRQNNKPEASGIDYRLLIGNFPAERQSNSLTKSKIVPERLASLKKGGKENKMITNKKNNVHKKVLNVLKPKKPLVVQKLLDKENFGKKKIVTGEMSVDQKNASKSKVLMNLLLKGTAANR